MTQTDDSPQQRLYSAGTLPKRSGFYGQSLKVTFIAVVALIFGLILMLVAGFKWGAAWAVLVVLVLAPMSVKVGHRTMYEWLQIRFQWAGKRRRGEHVYSSGPNSRIPGGRNRLPGLLTATTLHEGIDSNGNPFGMIRRQNRNEYTIVLECWPSGDEALTRGELDLMTADWGAYLAQLGLPGDIVGAIAVVETIPATGLRMVRQVEANIGNSGSEIASRVMMESATNFPQGKWDTAARLSITLKATTKDRRLDPDAMAAEIATRLPALYEDLQGAGVVALPMSPGEITAFVHRSHVPASESDLEELAIREEDHGIEWEDAGPSGFNPKATTLNHSGVTSITWEMSSPPEGVFPDDVLRPLLRPHDRIMRKRIAVVYRPINAGDATKQVDREYKDALTHLSQGTGVKSASAQVRVAETEQARQEQVRGAGLVRYSLLATATFQQSDEESVVAATVESLGARTRVKLQRAYGQQDAAFHASLGVGVFLPDHSSTSSIASNDG